MRRNGFTLIEIIIYIALLVTVMSALSAIYLSTLETYAISQNEQYLLEVRRVVEAHMRGRLEEATSVTTPSSGTTTTLVIGSPEGTENPVTFSVASGILMMQLGSNPAVAITPTDVEVTSFEATRMSGSPATVAVEIILESNTPRATVSNTLSFTVTLRYE